MTKLFRYRRVTLGGDVQERGPRAAAGGRFQFRKRLFPKYVALFLAVVSLALIPNGLLDIWFSYHEHRSLLVGLQREQARRAAEKIGQFIREIEGQLAWATHLPVRGKSEDEWRFDAVRMLRQSPAITTLSQFDRAGGERYRTSRQGMDVIGSLADHSADPLFIEAMANRVAYGPVYFVRGSEPHMVVAMAGARPEHGVIAGEVNLKLIWDVVSQFKLGQGGRAYVVDARGWLIAHPDISLVLRNMDLRHLPQVRRAREADGLDESDLGEAVDLNGRKVLSAYAKVAPLNWLVFVELPLREAYAPLYAATIRSGILLLIGLAFAALAGLLLARQMVVPIRILSEGAAKIGSGDLSQRISIRTGDELETLGAQFNRMTERLQDSYATLEGKVEQRTRQLELANQAKSRFLAAASHDLRQPLHALGLFVAQLRGRTNAGERVRIVGHIEAALSGMNELFNALLDISKLDAGATQVNLSDFPVAQLSEHIRTTFANAAAEKGLSFCVVDSQAWLRSDLVLLERIVSNLVSNAIRYTAKGGVVVGCRRRGEAVRIEVWDSGAGIPEEQHQNIFGEFYRLGAADQRGSLGLGLAIVDRLSRLLGHEVGLSSTVGRGSGFYIVVPKGEPQAEPAKPNVTRARAELSSGTLVAVIDDDPLVLEGMGGLLRRWGCQVVTGGDDRAVLSLLPEGEKSFDVIISDFHLREGETGIEMVSRMRAVLGWEVPAFLMSGDTTAEAVTRARANGFILLHKPVNPMALRATLTQVLKKRRPALSPEGV